MEDYQQILSDLLERPDSKPMQRFRLEDNTCVWIRQAKKRNLIIPTALGFIISFLGLPMLTPNTRSGEDSLSDEASRLSELADDGFIVPKTIAVRYQNPAGIMTADLGKGGYLRSLDDVLKSIVAEEKDPLPIWYQAVRALFELHQKGQYLGKASCSNMAQMPDHKWAYFGFQDDPMNRMDLTSCQVRDCIFFIQSTAHYFNKNELKEAQDFWAETHQQYTPETAEALEKTIRRIKRIKVFAPIALLMGCRNIKSSLRFMNGLL